ncbi:MAG: hypothetical protein Q7U93_05950 [Nitrosomonas sp.]|nr:hypothetical protein [Nitrosomonas sp.]MDO8894494.1 hypothetical protein [Nitrosomonas sp.]
MQNVADQTVNFTNGSSSQYDFIIAATGYKISFPFLDPDFINWEDAGHVSLYLRIFHPDHPSLFFIGLLQPQGCIWTLAEVQSKLIGQLLIRKIQLPSNWRELAISEGSTGQVNLSPAPATPLKYIIIPI